MHVCTQSGLQDTPQKLLVSCKRYFEVWLLNPSTLQHFYIIFLQYSHPHQLKVSLSSNSPIIRSSQAPEAVLFELVEQKKTGSRLPCSSAVFAQLSSLPSQTSHSHPNLREDRPLQWQGLFLNEGTKLWKHYASNDRKTTWDSRRRLVAWMKSYAHEYLLSTSFQVRPLGSLLTAPWQAVSVCLWHSAAAHQADILLRVPCRLANNCLDCSADRVRSWLSSSTFHARVKFPFLVFFLVTPAPCHL